MEEQLSIKLPVDAYLVNNFSADNFCEDEMRRRLENKYKERLEITTKFNRQSVSFQLSKNALLYGWLKYKEGFSADLVNLLLDEMNIHVGDTVMDPFFGSGTTGLVCQMRGINCVGFDIMPISTISINAKANVLHYDIDEIIQMRDEISQLIVPEAFDRQLPYLTITKYAYPEANDFFFEYIREWNTESKYSELSKNLLTLCVINSLERCSYTIKAGQYLGWDSRSIKVQLTNQKRIKNGKEPLPSKCVREIIPSAKEVILEELDSIIADIQYIQSSNKKYSSTIDYIEDSVIYNLPLMEDDYIHGVITSPPYCNRYDYTRTYALELSYLGIDDDALKKMRQSLLSCTVENRSKISNIKKYYEQHGILDRFDVILDAIQKNKAFIEIMKALKRRNDNGDLNNKGVIKMVEGYFTELAFIYAELYRVCKKGAKVAFVNDNVRYGGEVIPVDFLSSSFAEQFGFKVQKIYSLTQLKGNSSQQMAKYGRVPLRKSITIWEK